MANPFTKGWKYLMSSFDQKIDQNADPKVQIQQATEAAKKQHQEILQHASQVIGQQKQLEMKLSRLVKDRDGLQDRTRQALQAADKAAESGDATKSQEFNNTAEVFASQLVAVEQQLEETKALHGQATQAAADATQKSKESEMRLKEQLSQIDELRSQADQAAMQETVTKSMDSLNQFGSQDDSVPTLDAVRDKIERRYADALGAQELTQHSVGDRMAEIQEAGTDMRASARLEEIRSQMAGLGAGAATESAAIEATPETTQDTKEDSMTDSNNGPDQGKDNPEAGQTPANGDPNDVEVEEPAVTDSEVPTDDAGFDASREEGGMATGPDDAKGGETR